MELEEYKARVLTQLRKQAPDTPDYYLRWMVSQISQEGWEQYMRDFTPEELPDAWE